MGGWIGFGLALYAPERVRSLVIGGAHPYAENMQAFHKFLPQDPEVFLGMMGPLFGVHMTQAVRTGLLANDLKAIRVLTQDRTSIADVLSTMFMPCLLFVGETDPRRAQVQECAKVLSNSTFFSLPDCDHVAALARSDLVLPHVTAFFGKLLGTTE